MSISRCRRLFIVERTARGVRCMMYLQLAIAADVVPEDEESKSYREEGGAPTMRLWWGGISSC